MKLPIKDTCLLESLLPEDRVKKIPTTDPKEIKKIHNAIKCKQCHDYHYHLTRYRCLHHEECRQLGL